MSDEKCAWCNDDPRERLNGLCACNTRDVMEENTRLKLALEIANHALMEGTEENAALKKELELAEAVIQCFLDESLDTKEALQAWQAYKEKENVVS